LRTLNDRFCATADTSAPLDWMLWVRRTVNRPSVARLFVQTSFQFQRQPIITRLQSTTSQRLTWSGRCYVGNYFCVAADVWLPEVTSSRNSLWPDSTRPS